LIVLQQSVFEHAREEARAGHYSEAWAVAGTEQHPLERAQVRTYVRYHAGDLEGALREARAGLLAAARDPWLLAQATEVALALHHGAAASQTLAGWEAAGTPEDAPARERARRELGELRAAEREAEGGVRRGCWVSALAGALALWALLVCARRVD
jgi:hypothetical protein